MILHWFWLAIRWTFKFLFVPPPIPVVEPKIDPNEMCPSCGHRDGEIRAIAQVSQPPLVRHTCKVCQAQWYVKPILDTSKITAKAE
jgi:hypothetical protein